MFLISMLMIATYDAAIYYANIKFMCSLPLICIGFLLIIEIYNAYPFIYLLFPYDCWLKILTKNLILNYNLIKITQNYKIIYLLTMFPICI